jgi:hypothetical protein
MAERALTEFGQRLLLQKMLSGVERLVARGFDGDKTLYFFDEHGGTICVNKDDVLWLCGLTEAGSDGTPTV